MIGNDCRGPPGDALELKNGGKLGETYMFRTQGVWETKFGRWSQALDGSGRCPTIPWSYYI